MARERATVAHMRAEDPDAFPWILSSHVTPLKRATVTYSQEVQHAKEVNVARAACLLDGLVIEPGQTFSWLHAVGPTTKRRGFLRGPEMHDAELTEDWGGGVCSVSNTLYLVALLSGMQITERHRHGLDLFPDNGRTVPFGCGATVAYPTSDLRFINPHSFPVTLSFLVQEGSLCGSVRAREPAGCSWQIYESEHHFEQTASGPVRENRIRRKAVRDDGTILADEEVAHNRAIVLYELDEVYR